MNQNLEYPNDPLRKLLSQLSGQTVRFFPHSGNLGDGYITYATLLLFDQYKIKYTTHHQNQCFDNELIVIGGGGNFIEGRYEDVAKLIWEHRKTNQIILLPQTIVGYQEVLKETYNNLTVFCRENVSYKSILESGANPEKVYLSHDTTFFLPIDHFAQKNMNGRGTLNAFRQDGESIYKESSESWPVGNIDISRAWNGDVWISGEFVRSATQSMADFICQYEKICTDRLHVAIMSAFLGRTVEFFPNAYFKNSAVYGHSIKSRFPNVQFTEFEPAIGMGSTAAFPSVPINSALEWKARYDRVNDQHTATARTLNTKNQTVLELQSEHDDLKREIGLMKARNNSYGEEIRTLGAQNRELATNLELFHQSRSWRITKPLRAFRQLFIRR